MGLPTVPMQLLSAVSFNRILGLLGLVSFVVRILNSFWILLQLAMFNSSNRVMVEGDVGCM